MMSFSWIMAYNIAVCVDDCCYWWKGLLRCFDNRRVDNIHVIYIYVIYYEA